MLLAAAGAAGTALAAEARCFGETATITGAGTIQGTPGDDVIVGSRGRDVIDGRGGNDLICGGGGKDKLTGGDGDDSLDGGGGNDRLIGGDGDDLLLGKGGRDKLQGGRGADITDGGGNRVGPGDACDGETQRGCEAEIGLCRRIERPPASLRQGFYDKYCVVEGMPILGSSEVSDAALRAMATIVRAMLTDRDDLAAEIAGMFTWDGQGHRFGIMADTEVTTQLPEYADLNVAFPYIDWDARGRGFGATTARPLTSAGEENLLCEPPGTVAPWGGPPFGDPYFGFSVLVHEFAHTIHNFGLGNPDHTLTEGIDPSFDRRLRDAYGAARAAGLWAGYYSETDHMEYWAQGVAAYFNVLFDTEPASTRQELRAYDRNLYDLVDEVFGGLMWQPDCHDVWY